MRQILVAMAFAAFGAGPALALDKAEKAMIAAVDKNAPQAETLLEKLVNINSGTMNLKGVEAVSVVMREELEALGFKVRWLPMTAVGRAGTLVAGHPGPKNYTGNRMLLIGHMDTVFELSSPFQKYQRLSGAVAEGPGVNDMKGGLVVMLEALRAMQVAGKLKDAHITIVLSGDEERVGTPKDVARADMLAAAKQSDLALEFESLAQENGKDMGSIARRSSSGWTVTTSARSGHSSGIFSKEQGDGAAYELARILAAFRAEIPEPNLTFNVGLMASGESVKENADQTGLTATGKSNIIPPTGLAKGDMRTLSNEQTDRVRAKMTAIVAKHLPGADAKIEFSDGYPAMPPTEGSRGLLGKLNLVNKDMGLPVMTELDPLKRGAGDIAYVASIVDGLVGVGAAGEGSHAPGETIELASIPRQAKRMAVFMYRMSKEKRPPND